MKKINLLLTALCAIVLTTSCDSYLDKLPDDRAEINSVEKVKTLLTSAYPELSTDFLMEMSGDNAMDNGSQYTAQPDQDKRYRWEDVETKGNDDPYMIWTGTYSAIATANEALAGIEKLGNPSETNGMKAEALLCRAFGMFQLSNAFCMSWNPEHAKDYLGLPYPKVSGVSVDERGTLGDLYANINADIEAALPLLDDSHLSIPKYHFNTKAAYAFAARFNLYYMNYDKAIEYATKALGSNPSSVLRNVASYKSLAGVDDICNAYMKSGENANLMMVTAVSIAGRAPWASTFRRYAHARPITLAETFWASMPWSKGAGSTNNTLYESHLLYGSNQGVYYPKMVEQFETTDKVNHTGYTHIVDAVFTTDETLLVRAEAYALKNNVTAALADINTWMGAHCEAKRGTATRPTLTEASLNTFFDNLPVVPDTITKDAQRGVKKPLNPQGFTVTKGTQTNLLYCILQMRRIETWQQGTRFVDIKRYGICFSHNIDGGAPLVFKAGDLRGAIQLPSDVIEAGLAANPREVTKK